MKLYWQLTRRGQRLILNFENENHPEEVGGVRKTKSGFDAFAKTFGYDPGRAQKGFSTMEEAKTFVESFSPWTLFEGGDGLTVDAEVQPDPQSDKPRN